MPRVIKLFPMQHMDLSL